MRMRLLFLFLAGVLSQSRADGPEHFVPSHRVSGIGVDRDDLSEELLARRTDLMIESQTFGIMREAQALPGAKRITKDPKLQSLFHSAAVSSGLPATLIEAIAYLESWGDARAQSVTGPRGIMQISGATAVSMGLKVTYSTRYHVTRDKVLVKVKGKSKPVLKTVTHRIPYKVPVRDDRLVPERAIPAAARYLAGMEQKFGGRDWAIFAYHCGQGCVAMLQDLTRRARGIPKDQMTVARMFFSCSPAWNRELYEAVQQQMQRDYSPTYWFRIRRAEQLLDLYRREPDEFAAMVQEYKSDFVSNVRAPHRLSVWLKQNDLVYHNFDDIRADAGQRLVRAIDKPEYLGYALKMLPDPDLLELASPAAAGTLAYIAFETRRLYEETGAKTPFRPLEVTSLVESEDLLRQKGHPEALSHCSGQVFDIDYSALPPGELECLRFVLSDLGWNGYLGFVEEGFDNLHIGCSPGARDFFAGIYQEVQDKVSADRVESDKSSRIR
ncbi:MAG TPA: transglycosylase SLT domain-containing protein [Candidatus Acidoferrales bacterium]|nr:transglycosylase SLT domain-containing protein [Candidatus Acidoferrales bacterium]